MRSGPLTRCLVRLVGIGIRLSISSRVPCLRTMLCLGIDQSSILGQWAGTIRDRSWWWRGRRGQRGEAKGGREGGAGLDGYSRTKDVRSNISRLGPGGRTRYHESRGSCHIIRRRRCHHPLVPRYPNSASSGTNGGASRSSAAEGSVTKSGFVADSRG
jgi:hypothetical protein